MHVFSILDPRTLFACDFMVATAFAFVFFAMKRSYPVLRGINSIAVSFLLGLPGAALLGAWGVMPRAITATVAYCFIFASFISLYRGILRFIGSRRSMILPVSISIIAAAVLFYFSQVQLNVTVRIVAIAFTIATVRGLIALELVRKLPTFASATIVRLFAASMAFFAAATVQCGISTILNGVPRIGLESRSFSAMLLFLGLISVCATGLFVLMLSTSELIGRSRDESLKDSLSGAYNRRGIEAKLETELEHVQHSRNRLSVALVDVDYFKSINDVQGHAAGDAALRDVAEAISTHLRGRDYLGRYGGDEFLLILPNTPCSIALAVTDRLSRAVANLHLTGGATPITLSMGITEAVAHDDAATLLARADKALYQAKSDGRNCRRICIDGNDPEARQTAVRRPVLVPAGTVAQR